MSKKKFFELTTPGAPPINFSSLAFISVVLIRSIILNECKRKRKQRKDENWQMNNRNRRESFTGRGSGRTSVCQRYDVAASTGRRRRAGNVDNGIKYCKIR
jgi:hypothetical protein